MAREEATGSDPRGSWNGMRISQIELQGGRTGVGRQSKEGLGREGVGPKEAEARARGVGGPPGVQVYNRSVGTSFDLCLRVTAMRDPVLSGPT
jgi:hypothetical protein